jgi:hypothetical protein
MQNPFSAEFWEEWLRIDCAALGAYFSRNTIKNTDAAPLCATKRQDDATQRRRLRKVSGAELPAANDTGSRRSRSRVS